MLDRFISVRQQYLKTFSVLTASEFLSKLLRQNLIVFIALSDCCLHFHCDTHKYSADGFVGLFQVCSCRGEGEKLGMTDHI